MSAVRKQLAIRIKRPEFFRVINGFSSKVENHFFFTAELRGRLEIQKSLFNRKISLLS